MKKLARNSFWALLTVAGLWVLWELRLAVAFLLLALAVAKAVNPLVHTFQQRGIPTTGSVALAYASVLLILALTAATIGPRLVQDSQQLVDDGLNAFRHFSSNLGESSDGGEESQAILLLIPDLSEAGDSLGQDLMPELTAGVIGATSDFLSFTGYLGLVLIISLYWSMDLTRLQHWGFGLLQPEWRGWARRIWSRVWTVVGEVVRVELLISFTTVLGLWGIYAIAGVPYATVLALWAGVARMVPWLGIILAFTPLLLTGGLGIAAKLTVMLFGLIFYFLVERTWQRAVRGYDRPSRLLTGLLILTLGKVAGLIGVIMAPPVAAGLHEIFRIVNETRTIEVTTVDKDASLEEVRERLLRLREQLQRLPESEEQRKLADLVSKAEGIYQQAEQLQ